LSAHGLLIQPVTCLLVRSCILFVEIYNDILISHIVSMSSFSTEEVSRLVSYMFDKSPSERSDTMLTPFYSENPPPEV
jgi:hypothetical protein